MSRHAPSLRLPILLLSFVFGTCSAGARSGRADFSGVEVSLPPSAASMRVPRGVKTVRGLVQREVSGNQVSDSAGK